MERATLDQIQKMAKSIIDSAANKGRLGAVVVRPSKAQWQICDEDYEEANNAIMTVSTSDGDEFASIQVQRFKVRWR